MVSGESVARGGAVIAALAATLFGAALGDAASSSYPIPAATPAAASLIAGFEKFVPTPYNDAKTNGNCTIGYGTLLHKGPCTPADDQQYAGGISQAQALSMLDAAANSAAGAIDENVKVPLTANERDALTSFTYNVGNSAFENSTLLKDLNSGNTAGAIGQFARWNKQNGNVVQGLTNRRAAEACYFQSGTTSCGTQLRRAAGEMADLSRAPVRASAARAGGHRAKLHVASAHVRAGERVSIAGRGWAQGSVKIVAFVPGVSPYRRVRFHVRAKSDGRFVLSWHTSKAIVDTLRWKLTATERAHRSAAAYVTIKAS